MKTVLPIILLLLASCTSEIKRPQAPSDLIPRDTMVLIMHDLVIMEGHIEIKYHNVNAYHKLAIASGDRLLGKFNVTPARFEKSYNYYVGHQQQLQGIYTEVLDSLNKEVNEMRAKGVNGGTGKPGGVDDPFH